MSPPNSPSDRLPDGPYPHPDSEPVTDAELPSGREGSAVAVGSVQLAPPEPPPPPEERGGFFDRLYSKIDPTLLRPIIFFGGLALLVFLVIRFDEIFAPLLVGLAIAYLFDPAATWLGKKLRSRVAGVLALIVIIALVITAFFLYVVPAMGEQFERLGERLPAYQEQLEHWYTPILDRVNEWYPQPEAGPNGDAAAEARTLEEKVRATLTENFPRVAELASNALRKLVSNLLSMVLFLLNLIFIPVFAFYLLVDFPKIKRGFKELIPIAYRSMVLERVREVDQAVAGFVRGQLTIALILAAINATGMMIIGVPLGLLIGIVAGLANMIPYMALVVGLAPALLLCWVEHQSFPRLVAVAAVFAGAQLLEGAVLSPRILGKSVNLHPVWVLLAVIAGGSLFGFIGMLVAVPAAAAIQVFVVHWIRLYKHSRIYRAPPAEG